MSIKLNNDQVKALYMMVWMLCECGEFEHQVEPLLLDEILDVVETKMQKDNAKLKLTPSQLLVLFVQLNKAEFVDPYHRTLAINIVWQIDKQRVNAV